MSTVLTKPVLLDETGQAIVGKLQDIQQAIGGTGEFIPINIRVTTPPTKTNYLAGETLDLSGMVVTLVANNGGMYDVTGDCVFSPADGSIVTSSTTEVSISYTWYKDSTVFTAVQPIGMKELASIAVTTPPTQTEYYVGDALDLTGIVVTATFNDGTTEIVTNDCTFSPADGDTLSISDTTISISYTLGGVTKTTTQNIVIEIPLVAWSTGTDEQISLMINGYYDGSISLEDIKSVWSVGDLRTMTLDAIPSWDSMEAHRAQSIEVCILDFDHDILATPINGKTKALVSVQIKDYLMSASCAAGTSEPQYNSENGAMNIFSSLNTDGWNGVPRRGWCNDAFYNALPSTHKALVKTVIKSTASTGNTSSPAWYANHDKCFYLSEYEVFSNGHISAENGMDATHIDKDNNDAEIIMPKGGKQYNFFALDTSNKYKLPKWDSYNGTVTTRWGLRSPNSMVNSSYAVILTDGGQGYGATQSKFSISPAWCL